MKYTEGQFVIVVMLEAYEVFLEYSEKFKVDGNSLVEFMKFLKEYKKRL